VLSNLDDERNPKKNPKIHAHVTSVVVLNTCRKLGLASKLLSLTHMRLEKLIRCDYVAHHVRETNRAGKHLYMESLKYKFEKVEQNYYSDKENARTLKNTIKES
jgi:ribosomal protein S18 acetylase RimI-like enzyme